MVSLLEMKSSQLQTSVQMQHFSSVLFPAAGNLYVSIRSLLQLRALFTVNADMKVILYIENAVKIVLR